MLKQLSYLSFHAIPSLVNLSNHPSMFTERCWDMGSSPWRPCCGYGYSVTWTFPSPGWPQVVENSLGTVITFPGAPDGFSGMGYISILGALRHPCVPLWIWASEFTSPFQLVKNSFCLLFRTDDPSSTADPKPQPPLQALGGTPVPACLTRDSKPPA